MRRTAFALTAGLVALGLAACGGSGPSMPGEPDDPMMMQVSAPSAAAQAAAQLAEDDDRRAGGAKHR